MQFPGVLAPRVPHVGIVDVSREDELDFWFTGKTVMHEIAVLRQNAPNAIA